MKKHIAGIILLLFLGTLSWGQTPKEPFDVKKSREELEIMRGILNTTLKFVAQNSSKQASSWRFSNLSSFYLSGQGAVFVISSSGFQLPYLNLDLSGVDALRNQLSFYSGALEQARLNQSQTERALARTRGAGSGLGSGAGSGVGSGIGGGTAPEPPTPPSPPTPSTPPVPPAPAAAPAPPAPSPLYSGSGVNREELRKAVEEAQEKTNKARRDAEANREKFLESLAEIKTYLIEALANYGDSMTTVKPDEYVNLVIIADGFDSQRRSDVISARRSWITDYKAGRLNLEGFKQRVIQYTE